jgi:G:T-mismatch repair DNA endonuclease (very short patch repair protein)
MNTSEAASLRWLNPEYRKKQYNAKIGKKRKPFTSEHCDHIAKGTAQAMAKPEIHGRLIKGTKVGMRKKWKDPKFSERMRTAHLGIRLSSQACEKIRKRLMGNTNGHGKLGKKCPAMQKHWQDPEFVKKVLKGQHTYPNKSEQALQEVLQILAPRDYKYNGNFDIGVSLGGLIPDFVNVNGQKKAIDLHGDYWHKGEDTRIRARRYAKCGYKSLIIWECELKDLDKLQGKLIEFIDGVL